MNILVFVLALAAYSFLSSRYIPRKFYSLSNLLAALASIWYGLANGLSLSDMGLAPGQLKTGIIIGLLVGLPLAVVLMSAVFHRRLQDFFTHTPSQNASIHDRIHELGIRIPFGTAFSEEIMFRGTLLGLLLSQGNHVAILVSSILFGLWHVIPTLDTMLENDALTTLVEGRRGRNGLPVVVAIITTTAAGVLFGLLRLAAGSIVAPWLVHYFINGSAVAGGYLVLHKNNGQRHKQDNLR